MDLNDFIWMSAKIRNARPSEISELFVSLNARTLRALLVIFMQFFSDQKNREKYFSADKANQSIMDARVPSADKARVSNIRTPMSIFDTMPTLLLSKCISYLEQKDRAKASRINLLCLKAASKSLAKSHLIITNRFIEKELQK